MKISNTTKAMFIQAFQIALIWQDGELDHIDKGVLSPCTVKAINELTDSFVALLDGPQIKALIKDPDNFGHWLCLEQMGHGAGFFDSTDPIVSSITKLLDENELYRPSDLSLDDSTGILSCDFFKYGGS